MDMYTFSDGVVYRDVPGFFGYRAGDDGSVWSCRNSKSPESKRWKRLRCAKLKNGYLRAILYDGVSSFQKYVHSIILLTFTGLQPAGTVARHLDGNKLNNTLGNLRYGTRKENALDSKIHGTFSPPPIHFGKNNANCKINQEIARDIRRSYVKYSKTNGSTALAKKHNISQASVWMVLIGKTWVA